MTMAPTLLMKPKTASNTQLDIGKEAKIYLIASLCGHCKKSHNKINIWKQNHDKMLTVPTPPMQPQTTRDTNCTTINLEENVRLGSTQI